MQKTVGAFKWWQSAFGLWEMSEFRRKPHSDSEFEKVENGEHVEINTAAAFRLPPYGWGGK